MCRVYKAKAGGWYVRLCYYHGNRKGDRIPVPKGFELKTTHYPKRLLRQSPASTRKTAKTQIERCIHCGCPLSRHNTTGICTLCTEHPPKELEPWN